MKYPNIKKGTFLSRPNRFIAQVLIDGQEETVHVKNTGRCKELLVPGVTVYLQHFPNTSRKTAYDLIAVDKAGLLINMDSQAPNRVVGEWLKATEPFGPLTFLKAEYTHGDSRYDFYLEMGQRKMFLEVKGVTLENNGVASFPDAPTERGIKHLKGLVKCLEEGYEAAAVFVVQFTGAKYFTPNWATHPAFGEALQQAQAAGVQIIARECEVIPEDLNITNEVKVILKDSL